MKVIGLIVKIIKNYENGSFQIKDDNNEKNTYTYQGFLYLSLNDRVSFDLENEASNKIDINSIKVIPFYTMNSIKDMMKSCLSNSIIIEKSNKDKNVSAQVFMSCIENKANISDPDSLSKHIELSILNSSNLCCKKHALLSNVFKSWWLKNQIRRQLYCYGFCKADIINCRKHIVSSDVELFRKVFTLPTSLFCMKIEKIDILCNKVYSFKNKREYIDIVRPQYQIAVYIYNEYCNKGNLFVPCETLEKTFKNINYEILTKHYDIRVYNNICMMGFVKRYQTTFAKYISNIIENKTKNVEISIIEQCEETITDLQKEIVSEALKNSITIINGKAGTGKTSYIISNIINSILKVYAEQTNGFLLLGYTGKCVANMKGMLREKGIDCSAYTVHKSLKSSVYGTYLKNDPRDCFKYLIIDEATMVPVKLFNSLFKLYGTKFKLILIGDRNQNDSIDPGNIFESFLSYSNSNMKVCDLDLVHRTKESDLLDIFDNVLKQEEIEPSPSFIHVRTIKNIIKMKETDEDDNGFSLPQELNEEIVKQYKIYTDNFKNVANCKIITPYKVLSEYLNRLILREREDLEIIHEDNKGRAWHVGDMCMFLKNNYTQNVYNGDEGILVSKTYQGRDEFLLFNTSFGLKKVLTRPRSKQERDQDDDTEMEKDEENIHIYIEDITSSYCMTIDKSQGSQYNNIIFVLPKTSSFINSSFLHKKRIYTCLTRAKEKIIFIGNLNFLNEIIMKECIKKNNNINDFLNITLNNEVQN